MGSDILITQLRELRLFGMAETVESLAKLPIHMRPGLEGSVARLIEAERRHRDDSVAARLRKASKLPMHVAVEDIICSTARNLTNEMLSSLADCSFIRNGENLIITGLTGTGKTYLGCALGEQACSMGLKTLYLNMNRFIEILKQAKLDGTLNKLLTKIEKNRALLIDDFGLQELTQECRLALLTLLQEMHEKGSMIIISQLPVDKWYDYLAEPTLADAIMDRLIGSSHHVNLTGPSMRKRKIKL